MIGIDSCIAGHAPFKRGSIHLLITFFVNSIAYCIVPQHVEQYRTFLTASYERVERKDQWPPVRCKDYIKLATVVMEDDFVKEDDITKAMIHGKLDVVKRMRESVEMEEVS